MRSILALVSHMQNESTGTDVDPLLPHDFWKLTDCGTLHSNITYRTPRALPITETQSVRGVGRAMLMRMSSGIVKVRT